MLSIQLSKGDIGSVGTFIVHFEGASTQPISYDESASSFKYKLEMLPTIHTVNAVKRFSKTNGLANDGVTWVVRFTHLQHERTQGAGNIQLFTVTSSLTGTERRSKRRRSRDESSTQKSKDCFLVFRTMFAYMLSMELGILNPRMLPRSHLVNNQRHQQMLNYL